MYFLHSTVDNVPNLAPFSFFTAVAGFPPTIMFSVSYRRKEPRVKDTLRNVREVSEFVCHIVDEAMADAMVRTAMDWPTDVSEIDMAGITAVPSNDVRPFRVAEALVAMECKVTQIIPIEEPRMLWFWDRSYDFIFVKIYIVRK